MTKLMLYMHLMQLWVYQSNCIVKIHHVKLNIHIKQIRIHELFSNDEFGGLSGPDQYGITAREAKIQKRWSRMYKKYIQFIYHVVVGYG